MPLRAPAAAFLAAAYDADTAAKWGVRLGLDAEEVGELVGAVPALLELSPNTVKARLVGVASVVEFVLGRTRLLWYLVHGVVCGAYCPGVWRGRACARGGGAVGEGLRGAGRGWVVMWVLYSSGIGAGQCRMLVVYRL